MQAEARLTYVIAMDPAVDLGSPPKKRIKLVGVIVAVFVAIILILLIMPSSKDNRIIKAKEYLATEFPIVSEDSVKPLLNAYLVKDGAFVNFSKQDECAVFIFSPDPKIYGSENMINEAEGASYPYRREPQKDIPIAILLAPDESRAGWTLFAKIWIVKVLQKQQVDDLKELGNALTTNPKGFARLKSIWEKIPAKPKAKATAILEENRRIAKLYKSIPRFYRRKVTYSIPDPMDLYSFLNAFDEAHPELVP